MLLNGKNDISQNQNKFHLKIFERRLNFLSMNLLDYMKRTILLVVCFALFGFGCMRSSVPLQPTSVQTGWNTYVNVDYRFSFDYPSGMEMRSRPSEQQATEYMDLPGKFFASLRDVTREDQPVSIAYFYAMDGKNF